jgi:hypothetical protein
MQMAVLQQGCRVDVMMQKSQWCLEQRFQKTYWKFLVFIKGPSVQPGSSQNDGDTAS